MQPPHSHATSTASVREFALLDEEGALGFLSADDLGPVCCGFDAGAKPDLASGNT